MLLVIAEADRKIALEYNRISERLIIYGFQSSGHACHFAVEWEMTHIERDIGCNDAWEINHWLTFRSLQLVVAASHHSESPQLVTTVSHLS